MTADGFNVQVEEAGDLLVRQAAEEVQFDDPGLQFVFAFELIESLVNRKQPLIGQGRGNVHAIERNGGVSTAAFRREPPAGPLNENAAHGFGGGTVELLTVAPLVRGGMFEPQPCFMDEGGGAECVPFPLTGHSPPGDALEFGVDPRKNTVIP